jgi:hypothetical protein
VSWLRRLFGAKDDESAGGGGAWASGEVEADPRGGMQNEEYRTADPREVVEADGVAMSGPGGAPQDETTPAERRDQQRNGT